MWKCDGKLPACTACEKSGRVLECSSANDQFAKGKERRWVCLDLNSASQETNKCVSVTLPHLNHVWRN